MRPKSGAMVSFAALYPASRMNMETMAPHQPSTIQPVSLPTIMPSSTALVAMVSLRLSVAVAPMAAESSFLERLRL